MNSFDQEEIVRTVAGPYKLLASIAECQEQFRERSVDFDPHHATQERTFSVEIEILSMFRVDSAPVLFVVKFIKTLTEDWQ